MRQESFDFLQKYLNNPSPTGFEKEGQQLWLEYLKPYVDEYLVDTYGTVVGVINPQAQYKVVIEAHADEISYFVNYITKEGYLYLRKNGGSDPLVAPSKRVNIHTKKGIVKAVFGWPAIHVRKVEQDKAPTIETVFLDCGASSREEVEEMGVHVGSVVTFEDEFTVLNEKYYVGRALDNRIGGFMIAEVARMLRENNKQLPFGLYIVNAVQEEIGLRGAEMIAHRIQPDVAIITDVIHDTQAPMYEKKTSGDLHCGKGPVITYGPAVQNNLRELIIEAAQGAEIPFQRAAATRATGTDTDAFAYSNAGVASALISLPLKYMHTTVETVHRDDVENVTRLIYETLLRIQDGHDFRYFS
ncbi:M42 family metallopeptidase [Hymenobacter weizhouensis]|uniref:M42 family metallopeptidase n=1 Tax=Hymenobacter sp. YIM 151500-1 TaxID=2987689 RepID=UPI0022276C99|nr:M42 family metallopeptidase [Hymenobacter sp. YIM 151500-1]UYZ65119.1 M42 family metallopeptidase [Hymenobacter sp. YIM 151500-1]